MGPCGRTCHCEGRLAYFAIPRYVDLIGELPTTENGKVQKYKLRERGITETTWDRDASRESRARLCVPKT